MTPNFHAVFELAKALPILKSGVLVKPPRAKPATPVEPYFKKSLLFTILPPLGFLLTFSRLRSEIAAGFLHSLQADRENNDMN
jgi:hypothetical protein